MIAPFCPRKEARGLAAMPPPTPLTNREALPNRVLKAILAECRSDPNVARGEFSPELQAMLAPYLQEMVEEVLAWRVAIDLAEKGEL